MGLDQIKPLKVRISDSSVNVVIYLKKCLIYEGSISSFKMYGNEKSSSHTLYLIHLMDYSFSNKLNLLS